MTQVGIATGAGRGMGLACAKRMTGIVDTLMLVDRDEESLVDAVEQVSRSGPVDVEPFPLDVTDRGGLERLASQVSKRGTLRAVVHAAGISPTMADWKRILSVDLVGTALLVDALAPLSTAGTAIVCFASMAPHLAFKEADLVADAALGDPLNEGFVERISEAVGSSLEDPGMAYSWAKRGVQQLVKREAVTLGRVGARICCVSPGIIDTPQGRQEAAEHPYMAELVQRTPLAREGRAEEVAEVVRFLLSNDASFVTGIDVLVDGGVVAALESAATLS